MMKRIKWGVLGTAYIFERDTAEGMKQAENCELYAIAGRNMEKALQFKEKYLTKEMTRICAGDALITNCQETEAQ